MKLGGKEKRMDAHEDLRAAERTRGVSFAGKRAALKRLREHCVLLQCRSLRFMKSTDITPEITCL